MEGGEEDNEMITAMGIGGFGKQKKKEITIMGPPARPMVSFR